MRKARFWIRSSSSDADIALFTETWLSGCVPDSPINIKGYQLFRRDRVGWQHGGVCMYVKDIQRIIHGQVYIWNFSSSFQLNSSWVRVANAWDVKLNMRREIPYLQVTMNYFFSYKHNSLLMIRKANFINEWKLKNLQLYRVLALKMEKWVESW